MSNINVRVTCCCVVVAVALQQAERQLAREREQREEQNTAIELEWRRKTDKLLQQLKTVEADKNLLMVRKPHTAIHFFALLLCV